MKLRMFLENALLKRKKPLLVQRLMMSHSRSDCGMRRLCCLICPPHDLEVFYFQSNVRVCRGLYPIFFNDMSVYSIFSGSTLTSSTVLGNSFMSNCFAVFSHWYASKPSFRLSGSCLEIIFALPVIWAPLALFQPL